MVRGLFCGVTLAIRRESEAPFVHGRVKTPDAGPQTIELNSKCFGQAHSNGPRTGPGNDNVKYGCAFRTLCAPSTRRISIIRPLSRADAQFRWIGHSIVSLQQAQMSV